MDRGSGEPAGLVIRLSSAAARGATVTVCGDGCNGPVVAPIARDRTGFSFALPKRDDADPAAPADRCHARFVQGAMAVACTAPGLAAPLRRLVRATPAEQHMLVK